MNFRDAHVHGNAYRHRHHDRGVRASSKRVSHRFGQLILNLCLLAAGSALSAVAIHYYILGQDHAAENTPVSIDEAGVDFTRTILFSPLGAIPLMFGIRGEIKRMRSRNHKVLKRGSGFPH
jgi:hypothetical protein